MKLLIMQLPPTSCHSSLFGYIGYSIIKFEWISHQRITSSTVSPYDSYHREVASRFKSRKASADFLAQDTRVLSGYQGMACHIPLLSHSHYLYRHVSL
jgi:hypothetical protein